MFFPTSLLIAFVPQPESFEPIQRACSLVLVYETSQEGNIVKQFTTLCRCKWIVFDNSSDRLAVIALSVLLSELSRSLLLLYDTTIRCHVIAQVTTSDLTRAMDKIKTVLMWNLPSGAGFTGGLYYGMGGSAAAAGA